MNIGSVLEWDKNPIFFIKIIYTQIIVKEYYAQTKLFSDN